MWSVAVAVDGFTYFVSRSCLVSDNNSRPIHPWNRYVYFLAMKWTPPPTCVAIYNLPFFTPMFVTFGPVVS